MAIHRASGEWRKSRAVLSATASQSVHLLPVLVTTWIRRVDSSRQRNNRRFVRILEPEKLTLIGEAIYAHPSEAACTPHVRPTAVRIESKENLVT